MQHPDEGTIHTWLDGELSAEDAAAFEAHTVNCAQCAAAIAEARGLIAGSSRIVSALDSVPAGVIPMTRPSRRAWYTTTQARAAAALMVVAGTSLVVTRSGARDSDKVMPVNAQSASITSPMITEHVASPIPESTPVRRPAAAPALSAKKGVASSPRIPESVRRADVPLSDVAPSSAAQKNRTMMQTPALSGKVAGVAVATGAAVKTADRNENSESGGSLKVVRSDSSSGRRQTVFETRFGVRVSLTELDPPGFQAAARPSASARALAVPQRPAMISIPPTVTNESALSDMKASIANSIIWSDPATGRSYILVGPLSTVQLEALKPLVVRTTR